MKAIGSVSEMRIRLSQYCRRDIRFNEPHFTHMLLLREGNKEEVIRNLLEPEDLVHMYSEKGKRGDIKYSLYFRMSNTRTMKIPVILDLNKKKCIFVLTYIMRYRPWQSMIRGARR